MFAAIAIGTSICGIPVAMLLNAFASVLSSSGNQTAEDINGYPLWLCLIVFALLHFSPGSVLYGFFFGCAFAFVRLSTENLQSLIKARYYMQSQTENM